jgi:hypothetical protein
MMEAVQYSAEFLLLLWGVWPDDDTVTLKHVAINDKNQNNT